VDLDTSGYLKNEIPSTNTVVSSQPLHQQGYRLLCAFRFIKLGNVSHPQKSRTGQFNLQLLPDPRHISPHPDRSGLPWIRRRDEPDLSALRHQILDQILPLQNPDPAHIRILIRHPQIRRIHSHDPGITGREKLPLQIPIRRLFALGIDNLDRGRRGGTAPGLSLP